MAEAVRYRRLPGKRRGFFRSSSVWLAPDHLLLVKSIPFREEYKRYYLRDIQAIVVAKAERFHISTRAFWIAIVWWFAYLFVMFRGFWANVAMWGIALLLVILWAVVSHFFSCRCQISTAVSRDELPSLYRTWTTRRFLLRVKPLIEQAQGTLEGSWAEAVEERNVGPADAGAPMFQAPGTSAAPPRAARTRSLASDLMLGALFTDALWNTATLHTNARTLQVMTNILTLLVLGTAIGVIVQRYRGLLRAGMQRLAIATLAGVGLLYYVRPFAVGLMMGIQAANNRQPPNVLITANPWTRGAEAILTAALGLAGLVILMSAREDARPDIIYPST